MTTIFQDAVLTGEVRLGTERTFYNRFGDVFAWFCLTAAVAMILLAYSKKRSM
jgi:apolipoprotein N-acyltransferase